MTLKPGGHGKSSTLPKPPQAVAPHPRTLSDMDHTALRQFVAAATQLHFAHAARELGIPRSTLLASIRSMEAELGYELFDSGADSTRLTSDGEALLIDAQRRLELSAKAAAASAPKPGGKAKASKGKGRAPAVKGNGSPAAPLRAAELRAGQLKADLVLAAWSRARAFRAGARTGVRWPG